MFNRELVAFIEATKIEIEGHGEFKFNDIRNLMMIGADEYYLVYGITPDDHPTFMVFHAKEKEVMKAVVVEDDVADDVVSGYICWDDYLHKGECVLPKSANPKARKNRKESTPEEAAEFAQSVSRVAKKTTQMEVERLEGKGL
ncbi:hypothetical protein QTV49_004895 [Vibrio vulnificus]|nr:hypothetical protein [Vibrio vulnificus]